MIIGLFFSMEIFTFKNSRLRFKKKKIFVGRVHIVIHSCVQQNVVHGIYWL